MQRLALTTLLSILSKFPTKGISTNFHNLLPISMHRSNSTSICHQLFQLKQPEITIHLPYTMVAHSLPYLYKIRTTSTTTNQFATFTILEYKDVLMITQTN